VTTTPPDPPSPGSTSAPETSQWPRPIRRMLLIPETPGWTPPPAPPAPDPLDPTSTTTSSPEGPALDPDSSNGYGGSDPERGRKSSTTPGPGPRLASIAKPATFEPIIAKLVQAVSLLLDHWRSRETHTWLMHDEEADAIAAPLSRIAARHSPVTLDEETNDVLDGLEAGIGAAGYGMRAHFDDLELERAARAGNTYGVPQ